MTFGIVMIILGVLAFGLISFLLGGDLGKKKSFNISDKCGVSCAYLGAIAIIFFAVIILYKEGRVFEAYRRFHQPVSSMERFYGFEIISINRTFNGDVNEWRYTCDANDVMLSGSSLGVLTDITVTKEIYNKNK